MDLLEEFTTHMQQAMDREELLMGRPWIDTEDGRCHFRMKDLDAHLLRNNFKGMTAPKMAQRLRDMGGEPISMFLKGRTVRCWRIPAFTQQDAPFTTETVRQQGSPF
jgi:hypothetical protein